MSPSDKNIYFIRHSESEANATKIFMGAEAKLTNKGFKQSGSIADRISNIHIDIMISSPMVRALDTANIIRKKTGREIIISDLFIERKRPTEVYGMSYFSSEANEILTDIDKNFHNPDYHYSDEENFVDLKNRAVKSLEFIEKMEEENILIVTHGVFTKYLVALMCFGGRLNSETYLSFHKFFKTWNTGITRVRLRDGKWILQQWNDSAHLG